MAQRFPFNLNPSKYSRLMWNRKTYMYLGEFFRKAYFDKNIKSKGGIDPNLDASIDSYRNGGSDDGWALPCGDGGGYSGYFAIVDISDGVADAAIRVTDTGWLQDQDDIVNCGTVKINGTRVSVEKFETSFSAAGFYAIVLTSYIATNDDDEWEKFASIQVISDGADVVAPTGSIAFAYETLGRVEIIDGSSGPSVISAIHQDYRKGGEHIELLIANCVGSAFGGDS